MIRTFFALLSFLLITTSFLGQNQLPLKTADSDIKSLNSLVDFDLQADLESELKLNPKWKRLISEKKMAVGVVDMRDPSHVKFIRINGNYMMYAASLPKIAILLTSMEAIDKGELKETQEVKNDMRLMISKSNNLAATRMIDRVGYSKIEEVMTSPKYKFYDIDSGGGLWVGKRYGGGGDTNREPIKHLSHAATVTQVCRFYYLLANGKLVNYQRSKQMLSIMEHPEIHHKFVNTLEKIAPAARLFRKSGSWKNYHSDSILVWGKDPERRYILVALVDDPNGESIIRSLVKPVETVLQRNNPKLSMN